MIAPFEATNQELEEGQIQFYALYFYNLGIRCIGVDEGTGALIISQEEYSNVLAQMERLHGSIHNTKRYELFQWFKEQFPERLCKCPSNRRGCFGDEYRRICGLSNRAEIVNPDNTDVENALYVLRKYRGIAN